MAVDSARDGEPGGGSGAIGATDAPGGSRDRGDRDPAERSATTQTAATRSATGKDPRGSGWRGSDCTCGSCPDCAREGHRRAVAAFVAKREELAAGSGVPGALAHSTGASRQWVSDELTRSARTAADLGRAEGRAWLRHGRGALAGPLVGEDNRLSTSRTVAALWTLVAVVSVLVVAVALAVTDDRARLLDGLRIGRSPGLLAVVALAFLVAVAARIVVTLRVRTQRLQKVAASRPRAADVLTDDAGRGSLTDVQYAAVAAGVAVFAVVALVRDPQRLPDLPWGLAALAGVSAMAYLAAKLTDGGRPLVLSVVRAREAGDLDGPIRAGDDIEIRGSGFVPPGADTAESLARMVVRIGTVHVHVPLVPVAGGFGNPTDLTLIVPVPAEVEPGRVEVQVVTATGAESNRCRIDVADG
ncbi:hypothetical protein [Streptomyces sp. NPDC048639]|uniref:hypothetical protein n=1 Tax=Streptomyces sp. NPDC048639 TaxID=3365581 RepID=UPI0037160F4D